MEDNILSKYSNIKMKEGDILNFINTDASKGEIFEFHGVNDQHIATYRGSALHHHLKGSLDRMADISLETGKTVYLVDVDDMIKSECREYYYGKRMEINERRMRAKEKQLKKMSRGHK